MFYVRLFMTARSPFRLLFYHEYTKKRRGRRQKKKVKSWVLIIVVVRKGLASEEKKIVLPNGYPMCLSHFPLQRNHPSPPSFSSWQFLFLFIFFLFSWRLAYSNDHVHDRNTVDVALGVVFVCMLYVVWCFISVRAHAWLLLF